MEIRAYTPSSEVPEGLRALIQEKYSAMENFPYFAQDFATAFAFAATSPHVRFTPFTAEAQGKMLAHIALVTDDRRPAGESFFGFMEMPQDEALFSRMWDALSAEAKAQGIGKLMGPVNGSVWHHYRAVTETDGTPFFKSELPSAPWYHDYLEAKNPSETVHYHSGYRTRFDAILALGPLVAPALLKYGLSVRRLEHAGAGELPTVVALSRAIFKGNWGYVDLADEEFTALYAPSKLASGLHALYFLQRGEQVIGYASVFEEGADTLACKTMAILPEYQGQGLGNALAYEIHKDAAREGAKKMLYTLIRDENGISRFPKDDAVVFRRYCAYEFSL